MATTYLTFDEALKAPACYECGASSATCSYCGESASAHARKETHTVAQCDDETCVGCVACYERTGETVCDKRCPHATRPLVCGEHVCDEDGIGEFYPPSEPYVVAYEPRTWDSPGGVQTEVFCAECGRKREAEAERREAAAARARGEDC